MSNDNELQAQIPPVKPRRRSLKKRILLGLAIAVGIGVLLLSALLYNPVRTLATLEKADDFPRYVMHYKGTYLFEVFVEEGIE